jgi:predicted phosphodiesterase
MPLKIQILSDVHLEKNAGLTFADVVSTRPCADVLVLAGDIGCPQHESYRAFLTEARKHFTQVIVVAGNHEYRSCLPKTMKDVDDIITRICAEVSSSSSSNTVTYLQNGGNLCIGDVNFIGATLWSHVPVDKVGKEDVQFINGTNFADLRIDEHTPMTVETGNALFNQHLYNIAQSTRFGIKNKKKNVVITHHAPIIDGAFKDPLLLPKNYLYGTDLSAYLGFSFMHTWVYGHTHWNTLNNVNGTTCVCNQYGGNGVRGWIKGSLMHV